MCEKIRVLIVDDSPVSRDFLYEIISTDERFEVIGMAQNGREAVEMVEQLSPNIITMDLNMPVMDGFSAIEQIMAYHPTPILVVTTVEFDASSHIVFEALQKGALDIINRPEMDVTCELNENCLALLTKLELLSKVKVITHVRGKLARSGKSRTEKHQHLEAVVIVASSTGGPKALKEIFDRLPQDFPLPIVVVQHMSDGFVPGLVRWLNTTSALEIVTAKEGDILQQGNIYFAPTGFHLEIQTGGYITLIDSAPINGLRPCADVLFNSAAKVYNDKTLAVVLTGMGRDGTEGCKSIKAAGGKVLIQDSESCIIPSMPQNVASEGLADYIVPLTLIANEIEHLVNELILK